MLRLSGPAKNSGKIVTTLIRRGVARRFSSPADASVIEQTGGRIDADHASLAVHARHDAVIRNHHRSLLTRDVERESLRQLERVGDRSDEGDRCEFDAHPDEAVYVDLVVAERGQLARLAEQE